MTTTSWVPKEVAAWGQDNYSWGVDEAAGGLWGEQRSDEVEVVSADQARFGGFAGNTAVMFMGRRGNGKTLTQTLLADQDIRRFTTTGYPGHVFTNYNMSFLRSLTSDGRVITTNEALEKRIHSDPIDVYDPDIIDRVSEFPSWFRRGTFRGDEVQTMAMGRRSMARSNVNTSQFLIQMRHRDIDASFTTQFPQIIDYQVLLQIDLFIKVRVIKRQRGTGFPQVLAADVWDWWGQLTGKDWKKSWPPARADIDRSCNIHVPYRIMGTYSTKQIVSSVYLARAIRDRINLEEEVEMGGRAQWLDGHDLPDEDELERETRLHEQMEIAQSAYQEDKSVRFNGEVVLWADAHGRTVTLDSDKLQLAKVYDPSLTMTGLTELFESIGYTVKPRKSGGAKWYQAVKG